jgi:peptidoglycan/LPS O-acetylase OafA/YrhL
MPAAPTPIRALTSLRFFAAIYVLFLHSGSTFIGRNLHFTETYFQNFFSNGYLGVSLFFILSGFILSYVYRGTITSRRVVFSYVVARFARVYPVYLLSLLFMGTVLIYYPRLTSGSPWPQFLLLHEWPPDKAEAPIALWNPPAWTLSVELFFYLVFPLLARKITALSPRSCVTIVVALSLLIISFRLPSTGGRAPLFSEMHWIPIPLLRLPEFLLGCVFATLYNGRSIKPSSAGKIVLLVTMITIAILSSSATSIVSGFAAVGFALIIYFAAASAGSIIDRALSARVLVFMGGASYAIYILQTPIRLMLEVYVAPLWAAGPRLLYYPILLAVSAIIFYWYEEPIRRAMRNVSGRVMAYRYERGRRGRPVSMR